MLRRLLGHATALALIVPAHAALLSDAAAAAPLTTSPARTAGLGTRVVRHDVRLGHPPVRLGDDGRRTSARLTFRARKGRLVELAHWAGWPSDPCVRTTLRRPGGAKVRPLEPGLWRLPRTGTYAAVLRRCGDVRDTTVRVQVRKAVVHDAAVDGPATTVGRNPDVTHLVRVRLRDGERLAVDPSLTPRWLGLPDGSDAGDLGHGRLALEVGTAPGWRGPESTSGRHWLAVRPGSSVTVSRALSYATSLDAAATTLDDRGIARREHVVTFTGTTGQWVYPELVGATGDGIAPGRATVELLGPDGATVGSYVRTTCGGTPTTVACSYGTSGPWRLPASGAYRFSIAVRRDTPEATVALRVRAAAVAQPLALDGPAVTFTSTTPGQWVVASYTEGLRWDGGWVTAGNASTSLTDWRVTLAAGYPNVCPPRDTSNGCPDYWSTAITPTEPRQPAPPDYNNGPAIAVLTVPPGVRGSLDLRLTSQ